MLPRDNNVMRTKPDLRVVLKWMIYRSGSVITDVILISMNFADYKQQIATASNELSLPEKIATCLSCCRRLAPAYTELVRCEGWGDDSPFSQSRRESLEYLDGQRQSLSINNSVLEPLIPHTDDFGTVLGSLALNSGIAHCYLISLFAHNTPAEPNGALLMCYESTFCCVQHQIDAHCSRSIPLPEIDVHPMMIKEIGWQFDVLQRVRDNANLSRFAMTESFDVELEQFLAEAIAPRNG